MFLVSLINNWLISIRLSCGLQYYALLNSMILLADPSLVLRALVRLVYSSDERVQLSAADSLVRVLKYHNQKVEVICMLLDCLRYLAFPPPYPFPFSLPIPKVQLILSKMEFINGKSGKHLLEEEGGVLTATQTFDQLKLIILIIYYMAFSPIYAFFSPFSHSNLNQSLDLPQITGHIREGLFLTVLMLRVLS